MSRGVAQTDPLVVSSFVEAAGTTGVRDERAVETTRAREVVPVAPARLFLVTVRRGLGFWWLTTLLGVVLTLAGVWGSVLIGVVAGVPVMVLACQLTRRAQLARLAWVLLTATLLLLTPTLFQLVVLGVAHIFH